MFEPPSESGLQTSAHTIAHFGIEGLEISMMTDELFLVVQTGRSKAESRNDESCKIDHRHEIIDRWGKLCCVIGSAGVDEST